MKYAFIREERCDRWEEIFDDLESAVSAADMGWHYLTDRERNKQTEFCVACDFDMDEDCPNCISNDGYNIVIDFKAVYSVKPEFHDFWFTAGEDRVYFLTAPEIINLANEWEKPLTELMQQLNES